MNRNLTALLVFTVTVAFLWHATGSSPQTGAGAAASAGDSNGDGKVDISDAIHTLRFLFADGPAPASCQARQIVASEVAFEQTPGDFSANVQDVLLELRGRLDLLEGGSVEIDLIDIPAGTFTMGNAGGGPGEWSQREGPLHEVTITKPFKMGTTEVTQAQYRAVLGVNPSNFPGCPECPVDNVNWFDAKEFCRVLTERQRAAGTIPAGAFYRLPTEAEWEYACRAGTRTIFFFGDESGCLFSTSPANCARATEYLWWELNTGPGRLGTKPVGQKTPNPWGLHDMLGNVWEWCEDWYGNYSAAAVTDPRGPSSGTGKMARGGAWDTAIGFCRSSGWRDDAWGPDTRRSNVGFRVVLESP